MLGLGVPELLLVMGIIVIIFGAGKLPQLGSALGQSIREFRGATEEVRTPEAAKATETTTTTI